MGKMGSSQSKFKPGLHDCWHKMKVTGGQPKFLQFALQAIADLHESTGSSQGRIIDYIQGVMNANQIRPRPRNVAMQIKRALQYAAHNGMIKHRGGRYLMALSPKDFAIFKGLRPKDPLQMKVKHKKSTRTPKKSKFLKSKPSSKYKKYSRFMPHDSLDSLHLKTRKRGRAYDDDFYSDSDLESISSFSDDDPPKGKKSRKNSNNAVATTSKERDDDIKNDPDVEVKKIESKKSTKNIVEDKKSVENDNNIKKESQAEVKKAESAKSTTNKVEPTNTENNNKNEEIVNKPIVEVKKRKESKKGTKNQGGSGTKERSKTPKKTAGKSPG